MRFAEIAIFGLPVALAAPAQTPCTTSSTTTSTSSCTDEYKPTSKPHTYGYGYPVYNGTLIASSATYSIKSYSASSSGSSVSLTTSSGVSSSSETTTGSSTTSTGTSSSATDSTTSSATISETITTISSTTTTSSAAPTITGIDTLPLCGQNCFNAILGNPNDPAIGCPTADPNCLCTKPNFFNAIRDCSNGACGAVGVDAAPVIAFGAALCAPVIATFTPTTESTTPTPTNPPVTIPTPAGLENLAPCGQTCINAMLANYADPNIGCSGPDPACLCTKPNFFNGIRDCSNGACGAVGVDPGPVIEFGNNYCAPYTGGNTTPSPQPNPNADPVVLPTVPGIESQPECGRTCINNMINLYNDPAIGCPTAEKSCFCGSSNFFSGLGECSAGACQHNQEQIDGVFSLINEWCSS